MRTVKTCCMIVIDYIDKRKDVIELSHIIKSQLESPYTQRCNFSQSWYVWKTYWRTEIGHGKSQNCNSISDGRKVSWQTIFIVRRHIGLSMLPSHRIMRHGKQVYDDDDKYNKYDKPWTSHQTWRQVRSILHLQGSSIQKPPANAICTPDFSLISQRRSLQSYRNH